jgi:outer membrane protein assembly factor BamB
MDWPMYRADASRSGATDATITADLKPSWATELGGRLTQPVVGDGRLFVADSSEHLIHALDVESGSQLWSHVAGGRIDSPPTIAGDRVLFGSADGYVTCLQAEDGRLAWRFRLAPIDRRTVSFDQIESVWPVHGSVLVADGVATAVAGRSMYLDGGLRICRFDVATGRLLSEEIMDDRDPESDGSLQNHIKGLNMPVALTDILSSDGERLYMRSQVMDLEGKRLKLGPANTGFHHLFTPYGFTDDSWFHRIYWVYGDGFQGGVGGYGNGTKFPAGRILVNNDNTVFGFGRKPEFYRWTSVLDYQLFAAARPGGESGAPRAIYFSNTESLDPTGKPITVAAWIKTDKPDGTILVRGANLNGYALTLARGKPQMLLRTKDTTHVAKSKKAIGDDWTHVAGVLHGDGRMEVFVNGQVTGLAEGVPMLSANPSIAMKVGYDDTNQLLPKPLVPFSGSLDEVVLYHRALLPKEIQALAKPTTKVTGELRSEQVLHLTFDDGKMRDASPAGNHGRLENTQAVITDGPVGAALVLEQPKELIASKRGRSGSKVAYRWTRDVPMLVRAMALAGDKLLIAGPADVLDELGAFQSFGDASTQKLLAEQDAVFRGERGAILQLVDPESGETLAECELNSPPVFDGLVVAAGHVFISVMDGRVVALDGRAK